MTREEIKTVVELFISWNGEKEPIDISNLDSAVDYINECFKPSLPSNLDEAAEEFARFYDNGTCDGIAQECFKAGAEWMAGQGESHETEIVSRVTGNGLLPAVTCLVNKSYKEGDKVVVQIRKK